MEGQILYCTYLEGEGGWKYTSIPISQEYIESAKSANFAEPRNLSYGSPISASWDIVRLLVEELSKLCGKNGALEGWKLHCPGDLENIYGNQKAYSVPFGTPIAYSKSHAQEYGAKIILTRPITPSVKEIPRHAPKPTTKDY